MILLMAGVGHDVLYGQYGIDSLNGGDGDDLLNVNEITNDIEDSFDGGDGFDALRFSVAGGYNSSDIF